MKQITVNGKEEWRPILGYDGLYEVSSIGRIRSVDKTHTRLNRPVNLKGKVLKTSFSLGYPSCGLTKDGKAKTKLIHRLVAIAFIPNLLKKEQVNHKNGIKTDNRVENLEWCTPKENISHGIKMGIRLTHGEHNLRSKLTDLKVIEIKKSSLSYKELAKKYGVSVVTISEVKRNVTWKHIAVSP